MEEKKEEGFFSKKITIELYKAIIGVALSVVIFGVTLYMFLPWTWKVPADIVDTIGKQHAIIERQCELATNIPGEVSREDLIEALKLTSKGHKNIVIALREGKVPHLEVEEDE